MGRNDFDFQAEKGFEDLFTDLSDMEHDFPSLGTFIAKVGGEKEQE